MSVETQERVPTDAPNIPMVTLETQERVPTDAPDVPMEFSPLNLPSISEALREVYRVGSIPLTVIFVAAVVLFGLLVQGVVQSLPALTFLIGSLFASGVLLFTFLNWLTYRQWRDEVNARVENRQLEMELYRKLWTSNREIQDQFLLNLLSYTGELASNSDSTPEGRKKEIEFLSESLGTLVREFIAVRSELKLPEFTPLLSTRVGSPQIPGQSGENSG